MPGLSKNRIELSLVTNGIGVVISACIVFVVSQSALCQTHYTYDGAGSWFSTGLWSPSYPGVSVGPSDTVTVTASSTLTLPAGITVEGVMYNEGEMEASDGANLSIEGKLENNGTYTIDALNAASFPSFVAKELINRGTLAIDGPGVGDGQPAGMDVQELFNTGEIIGSGWLYISTDVNVVNDGTIDVELLQIESGFFETNDTLIADIFGYGENFGTCPGDTNIFVNDGYVELARAFMPCMARIENTGVYSSLNGYYDCDTLLNSGRLDIDVIDLANASNYVFDVFVNEGRACFRDQVEYSALRFLKIVNSDTLFVDSLEIRADDQILNAGFMKLTECQVLLPFSDAEFLNSGDLILDRSFISSPALAIFNTAEGNLQADSLIEAAILNNGNLSIGRAGVPLMATALVNSGSTQLKISGSDQSGGENGYQRVQTDEDITLLGNNPLEIILDGYMPVLGDSFAILQCNNLLGEFLPLLLPAIESCLAWEPGYNASGLILRVVSAQDSDGDGTIDCDDLCPNDPLKTDPGACGCGTVDIDSDGDGQADCIDADVYFTRQSASGAEGVRISGQSSESSQLWYLGSLTDVDTSVSLINRRKDALHFGTDDKLRMTIDEEGKVGIGRKPTQFELEISGQASKSSPGDWLANSDARLKSNIKPLDASLTFEKLITLSGVTYQWNDNDLYDRPKGTQFGLIAQDVQETYPELVHQDKDGWLVTSYGTFDPMFIAAFEALRDEVVVMQSKMTQLQARLEKYESESNPSSGIGNMKN